VCPDFNPRNLRKQPWRYAHEVACNLIGNVAKIQILTNRSDETSSDFEIDGVFVNVLQQGTLRFPTKNTKRLICAENYDVVYWFGNPISGLYIARYKNMGIPVVLHISQAPFSTKELLQLGYRKLWAYRYDFLSSLIPANWVTRLLDRPPIKTIIVPSKAVGMRLLSQGISPNKVRFAPLSFHSLGIAPKGIEEAKRQLQLKNQTFVMTYFGGSDTIRGTDTIVKSAMLLKRSIAGDFMTIMLLRRETASVDKDEIYLRRLIQKYRVEDNVRVISKILSKEELASYLSASDLVVLPFKIVPSEPPLSVLEALSFGKPVVTTDVGGLSELVTHNRGVLVKPADPKGLVNAICELMKSPKTRCALATQGLKFASSLAGFEDLANWTVLRLSETIDEDFLHA
jgi:phosphatidyl-myo-inositol dimannoside synthase